MSPSDPSFLLSCSANMLSSGSRCRRRAAQVLQETLKHCEAHSLRPRIEQAMATLRQGLRSRHEVGEPLAEESRQQLRADRLDALAVLQVCANLSVPRALKANLARSADRLARSLEFSTSTQLATPSHDEPAEPPRPMRM